MASTAGQEAQRAATSPGFQRVSHSRRPEREMVRHAPQMLCMCVDALIAALAHQRHAEPLRG